MSLYTLYDLDIVEECILKFESSKLNTVFLALKDAEDTRVCFVY